MFVQMDVQVAVQVVGWDLSKKMCRSICTTALQKYVLTKILQPVRLKRNLLKTLQHRNDKSSTATVHTPIHLCSGAAYVYLCASQNEVQYINAAGMLPRLSIHTRASTFAIPSQPAVRISDTQQTLRYNNNKQRCNQ